MRLVGAFAQDYYKSRTWTEKAKDLGSNEALVHLGWMQKKGKAGFSKDDRKAFDLYRQAADRNNGYGHYNVGLSYEDGEGVRRDYRKAAEGLRKGSRNGFVYLLGTEPVGRTVP